MNSGNVHNSLKAMCWIVFQVALQSHSKFLMWMRFQQTCVRLNQQLFDVSNIILVLLGYF